MEFLVHRETVNRKNFYMVKRNRFLYDITYKNFSNDNLVEPIVNGGCSAFVKDGKLYRNYDWNYDMVPSFHIFCQNFEGMAFAPSFDESNIDEKIINNLPYSVVDGRNDNGIRLSTHVLFNDWDAHGTGKIPLTMLPYIVLTNVKSIKTIKEDLGNTLTNLYNPSGMDKLGFLIQVLVTDGTTTVVLSPKENKSGEYEIIDITSNPKLTNFRWVNKDVVVREELQNRPTGVERFNMMPCGLKDLKFTDAYIKPNRLSEFIGIDKTTKNSEDAQLMLIYESASKLYRKRKRDGKTWQTMHSVVYGNEGMEHLWIQENWDSDYIIQGDDVMTNELQHWGILGQKWGVRRYQNKDGSLTSEGKKRYNENFKTTPEKIKISDLSNEDLRKLNDRLRLEKEFRELKMALNPKKKSAILKIVTDSLQTAGKTTLTKALLKLGDSILEKADKKS